MLCDRSAAVAQPPSLSLLFQPIEVSLSVVASSLADLLAQNLDRLSSRLAPNVSLGEEDDEGPDEDDAGAVAQKRVPDGVEVYEINGPFFFGVANNLRDALDRVGALPRVVVLRMRFVPHIDATGLDALRRFVELGDVLLQLLGRIA